jgi:hypothetical protein
MSVGRLIAATSAAFGLWLGAAVAQVPQGRVYVLHSPAAGACPSLDWHIVVEPNDILAGLIAWDDMKTMARATGKVDRPNHTFTMTAVELGGQGQPPPLMGRSKRMARSSPTSTARTSPVNLSPSGPIVSHRTATNARRRKYRLSTPVLAGLDPGLDPAIGYPQPIANDAIPISNHPMRMTGGRSQLTGITA